MEQVREFLREKLNLQLNLEKTKVTSVKKEWVKYLGVNFSRNMRKEKVVKDITRSRSGKPQRYAMKVGGTKIKFHLPLGEIFEKLAEKGFMERYQKGTGVLKPTPMNRWIFLDHATILQRYNAVIRGYVNYYAFTNNVNKLHHICFILKHSCAKTLARKLRLRSRNRVFQKFGPNLTFRHADGKRSISLRVPRTFPYVGFSPTPRPENFRDFLRPANWEIRTQSNQ